MTYCARRKRADGADARHSEAQTGPTLNSKELPKVHLDGRNVVIASFH